MKKKILAVTIPLSLVLILATAIFSLNFFRVAATEGAPTGEWTTPGSMDRFTYDGEEYAVSSGGKFGRYITVSGVDYYLIYDQQTLTAVKNDSGGAEYHFIIANDITLTSYDAVGNTYGVTVEGCGHTITFGEGCKTGLFNNFGGTVRNLNFDGAINGTRRVGAVGIWVKGGRFENLTNRADITVSGTYAGGFFGDCNGKNYADTLTLIGCVNHGDIRGHGAVGGLGGNLQYKLVMEDCENYGKVSAYDDTVKTTAGGMIGIVKAADSSCDATLDRCANYGSVSGNSGAGIGGMIGQVSSTAKLNMTSCKNVGSVTGETSSANTGGMVGHGNATGSFVSCRNEGALRATGSSCGGMTGYWGARILRLTDCTNTGKLYSSGGCVAGISGKCDAGAEFLRCVNSGEISGGGKGENGVAGIVAVLRNTKIYTLTSCVNLGKVTGESVNAYVGGIFSNYKAAPVVTIADCQNLGDVVLSNPASLDSAAGGIVASPTAYALDAGKTPEITVRRCMNYGNVISESALSVSLGGVLGQIGWGRTDSGSVYGMKVLIEDCGVAGNIVRADGVAGYAGGIVGRCNVSDAGSVSLKNSYFAGAIDGAGIVANEGSAEGLTVTRCFWKEGIATGAVQADVSDSEAVTGIQIAGGWLACRLNGETTTWYQTLDGTDLCPVPDATHGQVYEVTLKFGSVESVGKTYSNTDAATDVRIRTRYGASVRFSDRYETTGLRYISELNAYDYQVLKAWSLANRYEIAIGTLITPTAYLDGSRENFHTAGVFTHEALDRLAEEHYPTGNYLDVEACPEVWYDVTDAAYGFAGSVVNIRSANYTLSYSAIGYVRISDGENTEILYADYSPAAHQRSVRQVADAAWNDRIYARDGQNYLLRDGSYVPFDGDVTGYRYTMGSEDGYEVYSPYSDEQRTALAKYLA